MSARREKDLKGRMVVETISTPRKGTRSRVRLPDPHSILDQLDMEDLRLLQWLLRYPFQRAEDLALATGGSIATVYRHLNVPHDNSLVERVMPPALGTVKCWLYHLSNPGLLVLAAHEMTDPTELARSWNNVERGFLNLLPRLVSLITIQDCLNGLVTFAQRF